ncbi:MAG: class II aldolase/adducin family protein [Clostridiales Family XIII bacterium]|jgi:L-fuculose-phosphate aldolase|nr:class II aldolase/adducin family protein [Clostridiales Family XIII bacterium]
MTLYPSDKNAKKMILKVSQWMNERDYFASNDGLICCKIGPQEIVTVAGGVYKGYIDEDSLITVNPEGDILDAVGSYGKSRDVEMHLRVFRRFPMMFASIHAQPPYATLCALSATPLREALLPDTALHLGEVPLLPYAKPGSKELADMVEETCVGYYALLLQNRGLLAWGENLFEAWQRFRTAEQYAFITWSLRKNQNKTLLSKQSRDALVADRKVYCYYAGGRPFAEGEKDV